MTRTASKREQAERRGRLAEVIALWYLRAKGYRLLVHRYKAATGEIDLIMRKGDTTVFVEVKARTTIDDAVTAVSSRQSARISAAARSWMARDGKAAQGFCRFDIVAVPSYLWPTHIKNAFDGGA
jgi:putative endonuclease